MRTELESAEAVADVAEVARAAALTAPGLAGPERALALQRAAGNRAVARMAAAETALMREPTRVQTHVHETTTGVDDVNWDASFDVEFDSDTMTCWATIRIQLVPDGGISDDDVEWTKVSTSSRFSLLWDGRFSFHEHRRILSDRDWTFRPQISWVDRDAHEVVHLHDGIPPSGKSSKRTEWYMMKGRTDEKDPTKSIPYGYAEVEHAHEVSHQMGLLDEYADLSVPDRKTYDDHSLLGDYANEGYDKVTLQPRHGERMAKIIGATTDKSLTSKLARTN